MTHTTLVLFFLGYSAFTILGCWFAPYSWVCGRGMGLLPERITSTRWFRGATRVSAMVLLLMLGYGTLFLGWNAHG